MPPKDAKTESKRAKLGPWPVVVVGGGPVGMATALGLAQAAVDTVLVTPERSADRFDRVPNLRTAALFAPSLALMQRLGVMDIVEDDSAILAGIRIVDCLGGLLRAPEILFTASEIGRSSFGLNVPNAPLIKALSALLDERARSETGHLTWLQGRTVVGVSPGTGSIGVTLDDTTSLNADVVVAADGQKSLCRSAALIGWEHKLYDQVAVTTTFDHQRPHSGISTEFHRPAGPLTTVPMPGNRSSLVWVDRPTVAERLLAMSDEEFMATLENQLEGLLGSLSAPSRRGRFPLAWGKATVCAAQRVMLVGEAAHVMPPIGAQGLNLGLRDTAHLIDCIVDASVAGRDLGGAETMGAYNSARSTDIARRMTAVDALNRSLLTDMAPVRWARGAGLHALAALPALKRRLIEEGLHPGGPLPRLMRPIGV
jgi:2-octaprenyl-6-methoxyphenol hydroxylase